MPEQRLIDIEDALATCRRIYHERIEMDDWRGEQAAAKIGEVIAALPTVNAVVLPCKVGDDIYWLDDEEDDGIGVQKGGVAGVVVHGDGRFGILDVDGGVTEIGSRWTYLTREAAEAALAERRADHE